MEFDAFCQSLISISWNQVRGLLLTSRISCVGLPLAPDFCFGIIVSNTDHWDGVKPFASVFIKENVVTYPVCAHP